MFVFSLLQKALEISLSGNGLHQKALEISLIEVDTFHISISLLQKALEILVLMAISRNP